jgi:hypothetical protein
MNKVIHLQKVLLENLNNNLTWEIKKKYSDFFDDYSGNKDDVKQGLIEVKDML